MAMADLLGGEKAIDRVCTFILDKDIRFWSHDAPDAHNARKPRDAHNGHNAHNACNAYEDQKAHAHHADHFVLNITVMIHSKVLYRLSSNFHDSEALQPLVCQHINVSAYSASCSRQ